MAILREMKVEIKAIIERINSNYGNVVILQEENPDLEKRLTLWSQTNILLVATLRDGLCLVRSFSPVNLV